MRIKRLQIQNFRSFKDQTIEFGNYNCFVGANGAGKSTVLNALNVFFRESKSSPVDLLQLNKEDFHCGDTSKPIRIIVTFDSLSDSAKEELKNYVRQDQLTVLAVAEWSEEKQAAPVIQKGIRLGMQEFAQFFDALGDEKPVAELKIIYTELSKAFSDLPKPSNKAVMIQGLRDYEDKHPEKCQTLESNDEFYGISKGAHKLGRFIQWVFIPAVKDGAEEDIEAKDTALGRLVERSVRSKVKFSDLIKSLRKKASDDYEEILTDHQQVLDNLSNSLRFRLTKWAHPNANLSIKWDKDPKAIRIEEPFAKVSAGEGEFLCALGRMGHGLRRSFLLALLEELAAGEEQDNPLLLLGIEEPELFQHPPQAQYMSEVLEKLSNGNAQVVACTHSPYFVVGKGFEDVRLVRKNRDSLEATISQTSFEALSKYLSDCLCDIRLQSSSGVRAKIHNLLQPSLREMFFAPVVILVEGIEDAAYIHTALHLLDLWEKWRESGAHIVPVGGKGNLAYPFALSQLMSIPAFAIFDADRDKSKEQEKIKHQKDNQNLLRLLKKPKEQPFPSDIVWGENYVIWPTNLSDAVKSDYDGSEYQKCKEEAEAELGHCGDLEKNALFIASLLLKLWENGKPSKSLSKLCESLLKFANQDAKISNPKK